MTFRSQCVMGRESDPESMSDLVLLNALYYPGRIHLFKDALARKKNPDPIDIFIDGKAAGILRESYGVPVYQEQSIQMAGHYGGREIPLNFEFAPKGHFIGRTMMAVEALWSYRNNTKLK